VTGDEDRRSFHDVRLARRLEDPTFRAAFERARRRIEAFTETTRDPKRIDELLALLRAVWVANPDWRLGQLVQVAASEGARMTADVFQADDAEVEAGLRRLLDERPSGTVL
jgi:hypothetical protein